MSADFFSLVILKGAGVGLLLGNSDFFQHVQNGFTFYLKLSGQIIDSNLHSFSLIPPRLLRAHISTSRLSFWRVPSAIILPLRILLSAGSPRLSARSSGFRGFFRHRFAVRALRRNLSFRRL